jgi:hypothetical protein
VKPEPEEGAVSLWWLTKSCEPLKFWEPWKPVEPVAPEGALLRWLSFWEELEEEEEDPLFWLWPLISL